MIPAFNLSGVLPPFAGVSPSVAGMSPYVCSMLELSQRFCTSAARVKLFNGLVSYRQSLVNVGITTGYQWLDGSFCEDIENVEKRDPRDIDLVTLFLRPNALFDVAAWKDFVTKNQELFDRVKVKGKYACDAFYVDLVLGPEGLPQVTYWFGLFTHQRATLQWKGILSIPLTSDDSDALKHANSLLFSP